MTHIEFPTDQTQIELGEVFRTIDIVAKAAQSDRELANRLLIMTGISVMELQHNRDLLARAMGRRRQANMIVREE